MASRRHALTLLALLLTLLSVANAQISSYDPNAGGGDTGGGGMDTGGGDAGGGAGTPAGDDADAALTPPPPPPPPPPQVTMYGNIPLVEGEDKVGPVSEQTGYRYQDLQDVIDAAEADPRVETRDALIQKYGAFGEGGGAANDTTLGEDGEDPDADKDQPSPLSFLYGVDESAADLNKRLICRRGCVDPLMDVNLVWCAGVVNYNFCNRTITGPKEVSVLNMESGAIAAYMSLSRKTPTADSVCKQSLRAWMCYEFFNRCNADGTQFYPVCHTTCQAARFACGDPDWIDCDEEVEELEGGFPPEWLDPAGGYIRGVKPDGQSGNPVFETDALRCTGGSGRRFGSSPAFAALVASLVSVVLIAISEVEP